MSFKRASMDEPPHPAVRIQEGQEQKGRPENPGRPFCFYLASTAKPATYPILFRSGTMSRETMLMILIIGLTAGPAVSL